TATTNKTAEETPKTEEAKEEATANDKADSTKETAKKEEAVENEEAVEKDDATKEDDATKKDDATASEEASKEEASAPEPKEEPVASAHDDFDWSIDKRHVSTYSKEDKEKYEKMYDGTFKDIEEEQVLKGNVVSITNADAVINIGFKSDGLISLNEFR